MTLAFTKGNALRFSPYSAPIGAWVYMRTILLAALTWPVLGQSASPAMTGAQLGYVFDARTIWAVSGVPGAAALDANLGIVADSAFVHSRARLAVANVKGGALGLVRWERDLSAVPVETSLSRAMIVAFSPSGSYAAVSDGTAIELWSGLRNAPGPDLRIRGRYRRIPDLRTGGERFRRGGCWLGIGPRDLV